MCEKWWVGCSPPGGEGVEGGVRRENAPRLRAMSSPGGMRGLGSPSMRRAPRVNQASSPRNRRVTLRCLTHPGHIQTQASAHRPHFPTHILEEGEEAGDGCGGGGTGVDGLRYRVDARGEPWPVPYVR